jgi:uncharacterized membrane-anchored protein YhcB (DUF1043 family)
MLEVISTHPGLAAALLVSGAAVGVLVAGLVLPGPKRVRQLEEELEKVQKEHESYRSGVTAHFKTTAELVGEMTQSYKAVYDHLAYGAQSLCGEYDALTLAYGAQSLCGEYDALTSSVFGPSRIIHDPKVAVGETLSGQPESAATPPDVAGESTPNTGDPTPSAPTATSDADKECLPESLAQSFSMGDGHGLDTGADTSEQSIAHASSTEPRPPTERGTTV